MAFELTLTFWWNSNFGIIEIWNKILGQLKRRSTSAEVIHATKSKLKNVVWQQQLHLPPQISFIAHSWHFRLWETLLSFNLVSAEFWNVILRNKCYVLLWKRAKFLCTNNSRLPMVNDCRWIIKFWWPLHSVHSFLVTSLRVTLMWWKKTDIIYD